MLDANTIFWCATDIFVILIMLFIAFSAVIMYRYDRRHNIQRSYTKFSLTLYAIGFELGLVFALAMTIKQTLSAVGLIPRTLPADVFTIVRALSLILFLTIVGLFALAIASDWRTIRHRQ